jgi:hypothetical protein
LVQTINSHTELCIQNLLQTIEELETYEVEIAGKGQQHDVGYAMVERLGQLRQAGVVLSCLLPELLGQRLQEHQKMTGYLPYRQPKK